MFLRFQFGGRIASGIVDTGRRWLSAIINAVGRIRAQIHAFTLRLGHQLKLVAVRIVSGVVDITLRWRSAIINAGNWLRTNIARLGHDVAGHPALSGKAAAWVITVLFFLYAVLLSLHDFYPAMVAVVVAGVWLSLCWIVSNTGSRRLRARKPPARVKWEVLFIIIVSATCWCIWTRSKMFDYQLSDVLDNLKLEAIPGPGAEDKPMETYFTVRNDGHFDISRMRTLSCRVNFAVLNNRPLPAQAMYSTQIPAGVWVVSGGPMKPEDQGVVLKSRGDAESEQCLGFFHTNAMDCLDATVVYSYYLVVQPKLLQEKRWHMIAKRVLGNAVRWYQEPSGGGSYGGCVVVYPPSGAPG